MIRILAVFVLTVSAPAFACEKHPPKTAADTTNKPAEQTKKKSKAKPAPAAAETDVKSR